MQKGRGSSTSRRTQSWPVCPTWCPGLRATGPLGEEGESPREEEESRAQGVDRGSEPEAPELKSCLCVPL